MGLFDDEVDGTMDEMLRMLNDDFDGDSEEEDEFFDELEAETGIDRDEWEMMDDDERAEALEEAGLDPDDFDDY